MRTEHVVDDDDDGYKLNAYADGIFFIDTLLHVSNNNNSNNINVKKVNGWMISEIHRGEIELVAIKQKSQYSPPQSNSSSSSNGKDK